MAEFADLTTRQKQILEYIRACVEQTHVPPSVREIGEAIGLSSPSSVHVHLRVLEDKGYIARRGSKSRSMIVTEKARADDSAATSPSLPGQATKAANPSRTVQDDHAPSLVTLPLVGRVAAGAPILAEQNVEEQVALPTSLVGDQGSFLLTVHGDSMINAGIFDGDVVVVREQDSANNGDIVVALLDDGATVKTYYRERDCIRLQPQNPALEPIFTRNASIVGVVIGLFRSLN